MKERKRSKSLETLSTHVLAGYPAAALQRIPRPSSAPRPAQAVVRVLDIQQMPLTRPNAQQVSVLICSEPACSLALGLVGHVIGLRNYEPETHESFREQVIVLDESNVFQQGRRRWFACPGIKKPCGSRRMKLYLPPGETVFACAECHELAVPHAPERPLRWRNQSLPQEVLRWHEPVEMQAAKGA
jgi:hypothetical protein